MFEKMKLSLSRIIADQLRCPTLSIGGRFVSRHFQRKSAFLEKGAVKLLNIQPDDRVLEVGFGGGVGLRTAYWRVAEGTGVIYGVDRSHFMLAEASKFCGLEIAEDKVNLSLSMVTHLPYPTNFFDRVFHCNTYFYWDNIFSAVAELQRVMKPGGLMVATLSLDDLKEMDEKGYLQGCRPDPLDYMHALEIVGFENVHIKYMTGNEKSYQGIFSTKPAVLEDSISEESWEMEEERFRKAMSAVKATETMAKSGRPAAPGFDPLATNSKVSSNTDNNWSPK